MSISKKTRLLFSGRVFPCTVTDAPDCAWTWPAVRTLLESHGKDNFLSSETRVLDGIESLALEFVTVELRYASQNVSKGVLQLEGGCQVVVGASSVAAGRMLVLCFSEPLAVNTSCRARGIIGFLPWFCARIALDASGVVELDRILCVSHGAASVSDSLICKRLIPAKRPLFALHTAEAASDVEVNVPLPAVLSFALMWQMARKQKKAPTESRLLLTQKSYKYFGQQSPRDALFSTKAGFLALRNTLALADSEEVAAFVAYQLSDAFRSIMETECSSDVVLLLHLHSLLVPLSCAIAHLQSLDPTSFVEVDFIDHFAAEARLTEAEAEFLANEGAESLCLSFDFGRGGIIADALISIGNAKWREICVLKAGRAYISDRSAMVEIACAVFHTYLRHASAVNRANATGDWFEKFLRAMPGVRGLYAEAREEMFDDIYLNTLAHKSAAPRVDLAEFRSFSLNLASSITMPADISLPELYGIRDSDVVVNEPFVFPSMHLAMCAAAQSSATNAAIAYGAQSDEASLLQLRNRAPALDIEDLVENLHTSRVLPLCMEQFYQRIVDDNTHLKNQERQEYYKLIASLEIENVNTAVITHHMTRATPAGLKREQSKDISGFRRMADRAHVRNAESTRSYLLASSGSNISREEALDLTTPALSCHSMVNFKRCPYAGESAATLQRLLLRAGVDAERAYMIAEGADRGARASCHLHLHAAVTDTVTSKWPLGPVPAPANPRDFVRYAASARLAARKSNQQ